MDCNSRIGRWRAYYRNKSRAAKGQFLLVSSFIVGAVIVSSIMKFTERDITVTGSAEEKPLVTVISVKPETIRPTHGTSGVVQVPVPVSIVPQVSGRVETTALVAKTGRRFEVGQVLFKIDTSDYETARARAEAALHEAKTNLSLALADAEMAVVEWGRLHPREPAPALVAKEPQVFQSRAAVAAAQADLELAQLNIERATVSFPFAGLIESISVEVGQYVQMGQSYGQVYPEGGLEIKVPLSKEKTALYPAEMVKAEIRSADTVLELAGARTGAVVDPTTRLLNLYFLLSKQEQQALNVLPGAFVEVTLFGVPVSPAYRIPTQSFFDGKQILLVEKGRVQSFAPEILSRGATDFVIRGRDMPLEVVYRKPFGVGDGMLVRVERNE